MPWTVAALVVALLALLAASASACAREGVAPAVSRPPPAATTTLRSPVADAAPPPPAPRAEGVVTAHLFYADGGHLAFRELEEDPSPEIAPCYARALDTAPDLAGWLTVSLSEGAAAERERSPGLPDALVACALHALEASGFNHRGLTVDGFLYLRFR